MINKAYNLFSLSNTVDDGDDDLSGFLLGLSTSHATLGGSWVETFTTDGIATAGNPLLAYISHLLRHAREHSGSILLTTKLQGASTKLPSTILPIIK